MEELLAQLSTIARSMWRFRWPSVLVAWLVGIAGAVVAFTIPDRYEASSRVYVDTESILKPLMSGLAVQPNVDQQVEMLSRTLISRPNVEKLVRMADLDLKSQSKIQQDAMVTELMSTLQIKSVGRDNLYTLAYRDSDAAKAQRVIQSFVSIFIESSLGTSRKDTDTAKIFINDQIKAYEAKLLDAESRLKEFRLRNIQLQTSDGKDSVSRLGELRDQLDRAKLELREAEQARDASRQQLENEKSQSAGGSPLQSLLEESAISVGTPEIDARIDTQKRNLDALLQRFTEEHPDVVVTRKLIRDLEEQKKKEVKELRKAALANPSTSATNNSLVYQELNKLMANAEVQVAALRARVAEYSSRYNQARDMLKSAPEVEAEASQLNRDYEINKKNYEDLVKRREAAAMSGNLDSAAGVADFRLIDPPRVSANPVWPNRLLLLSLAMMAAIAAGALFAFAASQLRPVFHSASDLRSKFEIPLLGMVSMVTTEADHRRERVDRFKFVLSSGGLVGIFLIALIGMSLIAARQG
jgi:polysaccharide chain length determinant protein (PEP-CTERM system associated)